MSADTIVPKFSNPQSLNRYTYVLNSPLNLIDPSGHCAYDASGNEDRTNDGACWGAYDQAINSLGNDFNFLAGWQEGDLNDLLFWLGLGVSVTNMDGGLWDSSSLSTALLGLNDANNVINNMDVIERILGLDNKGLTLIMCPICDPGDNNHDYTPSTNSITFDDTLPITVLEFLHEVGHVVDWNIGSGGWFRQDWWSNEMLIGNGWTEVRKSCWLFFTCATGQLTQDWSYTPPNPGSFAASPQEDFADTFAGYILDGVGAYPATWSAISSKRINALSVKLQP